MALLRFQVTRVVAILLLAACAGGCPMVIQVPYPVQAQSVRLEDVGQHDARYVTLGPRRLIQKVGQRLEKRVPNSELVDALMFRDTAFPEGGWSFARLLDPAVCTGLRDALSVQYAVLLEVGPVLQAEGERYIPFGLGVTGYEVEQGTLSAIVIDLGRAEIMCRAASSASGKEMFFVTWAGGYAANPITVPAVLDGLADTIAGVLMEQPDRDPIGFVVLAVEPNYLK